jgi:hypothetical protein
MKSRAIIWRNTANYLIHSFCQLNNFAAQTRENRKALGRRAERASERTAK